MSKIRIKYFGPIKEGLLADSGWINIGKVTIFIGNQGSGKSTVTKIISTFMWIEKVLIRGDYPKEWFEDSSNFKNRLLKYHRLESYFNPGLLDKTEIEYKGEAYNIEYVTGQGHLKIVENKNQEKYCLPQIMYVPAERNFISYVKSPKELKLSSDSLKEFLIEFDNAKQSLSKPMLLPIDEAKLDYDKLKNTINIIGNDFVIKLMDSSSGFQSFVPLYLVSQYLTKSIKDQTKYSDKGMTTDELERFKKGVSDIWNNDNFTDEQKRTALSVLSTKFNKSAFINIIEEPEQNLYPATQWSMLQSLLSFNNATHKNKLLLTTHSPYIVNYMNIIVQAYLLKEKIIKHSESNLLEELKDLIPLDSLTNVKDIAIYQMEGGNINNLPVSYNVFSDNNFLNNFLKEGNTVFDKLLELEEKL